MIELYKTLVDLEYRNQNKRGGRPMVIAIPAGSVGELKDGCLVFCQLSRRGHNPFVFWNDVWKQVERVEDSDG